MIWNVKHTKPNNSESKNGEKESSSLAPYLGELLKLASEFEQARVAMAADPAFIERWIKEHGPYLYHGAHSREGVHPDEIAQKIEREGLHPNQRPAPKYPEDYPEATPAEQAAGWYNWQDDERHGELDHELEEHWLHPRADHVFLTTDLGQAYGPPAFRVDLRKLDPRNLNPDDDYLRETEAESNKYQLPPKTLGEEAEERNWGENPEDTHDSMEGHGIIGHRGPIPPDALERVPDEDAIAARKVKGNPTWEAKTAMEGESWDPKSVWPVAERDYDRPIDSNPKKDCTCEEGHKLDCPLHGLDADVPLYEHLYDVSDHVSPRGINAEQPRTWLQAKTSALTQAQMLQIAKEIEEAHGMPDQSKVVYEYPNGWTMRQLQNYADLNREGKLMKTCWREEFRHEPESHQEEGDPYRDWKDFRGDYSDPITADHFSLRDPDNIPHVSIGGEYGEALGRHNSEPKPEYHQMIDEYAQNQTALSAPWGGLERTDGSKWIDAQWRKAKTATTPMGFGTMYHVSPRRNRGPILNEGLQGHEREDRELDTPHEYERNAQPEGNYLFDNVIDAESYANALYHRSKPHYEEERWDWPEDEDEEPTERDDDPHGYDIYAVHAHGLPVGPDPEAKILHERATPFQSPGKPWDLGRLHDSYENAMAEQPEEPEEEVGDYHGWEPRRYWSPTGISPQRVQLFRHLPRWKLVDHPESEEPDYDAQEAMWEDERAQSYPKPWALTPMTEWPMPGHEGKTADAWDSREFPDSMNMPPMLHGPAQAEPRGEMKPCTCPEGKKLDCPIHGLYGKDPNERTMEWSIAENSPTGYPQDQPQNYTRPPGTAKVASENGYWHFAPTVDRERIRTHGLQPATPVGGDGRPLAQQPSGVYVFDLEEEPPLNNAYDDLWHVPGHEVREMSDDPLLGDVAKVIPHAIPNPVLHRPGPETIDQNQGWWPKRSSSMRMASPMEITPMNENPWEDDPDFTQKHGVEVGSIWEAPAQGERPARRYRVVGLEDNAMPQRTPDGRLPLQDEQGMDVMGPGVWIENEGENGAHCVPLSEFQNRHMKNHRRLSSMWRMAVETRAQMLRRAQELEQNHGQPDQSEIVHQWPDGWTVRRLTNLGDLNREGELMSNCWREGYRNPTNMDEEGYDELQPGDPGYEEGEPGTPDWENPWQGYKTPLHWTYHSLRDPDNLPHVSMGGPDVQALGRHNDAPKPEYMQRVHEAEEATGKELFYDDGSYTSASKVAIRHMLLESCAAVLLACQSSATSEEDQRMVDHWRQQPYLYHASPQQYRAQIEQEGLTPRDPAKNGAYVNHGVAGVYVEADPESALYYWGSPQHDLWEIPQEQVKDLRYDPEGEAAYIPHAVRGRIIPHPEGQVFS